MSEYQAIGRNAGMSRQSVNPSTDRSVGVIRQKIGQNASPVKESPVKLPQKSPIQKGR